MNVSSTRITFDKLYKHVSFDDVYRSEQSVDSVSSVNKHLHHDSLLRVEISTDVCNYWTSRCTLEWIYQQQLMIQPSFTFFYTLPTATESPYGGGAIRQNSPSSLGE